MGQFITEAAAKDFLKTIYDSAYFDHAGDLQESLLTEDIAGVEGTVLGYVRETYDDATEAITETLAPEAWQTLRELAFALLLKKAYMRFDYVGMPQSVADNAKDAIFRLLDIQKGKFKLPGMVQTPKSSISMCFGSAPAFSRSAMRGI
jgi:hypothetical protein